MEGKVLRIGRGQVGEGKGIARILKMERFETVILHFVDGGLKCFGLMLGTSHRRTKPLFQLTGDEMLGFPIQLFQFQLMVLQQIAHVQLMKI